MMFLWLTLMKALDVEERAILLEKLAISLDWMVHCFSFVPGSYSGRRIVVQLKGKVGENHLK